nr:MAG TPA: hypothetical protein [Caudoviricetes sp.]
MIFGVILPNKGLFHFFEKSYSYLLFFVLNKNKIVQIVLYF